MEHVVWSEQPSLRTPTLIAAFTGWNDAGDAASGAAQHLAASWQARKIATIDPEDFFEFQATRPQVRLRDGHTREIVWPPNELYAASTPTGDVLVLSGTEPQLRWRTFCEQIIEVAKQFDVRLVLTLGALLADVPHTRPVRIIGTASEQQLIDRFELQRSRYQGPTGIVGVLQDACTRMGLSSASLWAAVPSYAPGTPSPKATLALVQRTTDIVGLAVETHSLERKSLDYEQEMTRNVADDDDLAGYVNRLESAFDDGSDDLQDDDADEVNATDETDDGPELAADPASADQLVEEVERFLRDQGS